MSVALCRAALCSLPCRADWTEKLAAKSAGGRVEALYFAFGETDAFAIVEVPDNASAAALALAVSASGASSAKTTVLLTPEEMDAATKKPISYLAPGRRPRVSKAEQRGVNASERDRAYRRRLRAGGAAT